MLTSNALAIYFSCQDSTISNMTFAELQGFSVEFLLFVTFAFAKSMIMTSLDTQLSVAMETSSVNSSSCVSHDLFLRKTCCWETKMLESSRR